MDHRNHIQDHSVDIQKLPQNQESLLIVLYFVLVIAFVIFFVKCVASDKKLDFSDPEDILLDPKEIIVVQNLPGCGLLA